MCAQAKVRQQKKREKMATKVQTSPSHQLGYLPKSPNKLRELSLPHVESFNYFLDEALDLAVDAIPGQEITLGDANQTHISWWIESVSIDQPTKNDGSSSKQLTPRECRERGMVYSGAMTGTFRYSIDGGNPIRLQRSLGMMPIMVLSNKCRLKGKTPEELIAIKEEAMEFGGYFIVNGIERVMRILQVPRRDYATAVQRSAFKNRGPNYSDKAVTMRCARPDQSTQTVSLHYLTNGSATLRFSIRKQEFLVPIMVLVRALGDCTDIEVYNRLLQGESENMFLSARLELLLQDAKKYASNRKDALAFLGQRFRTVMSLPDGWSNAQCGASLIKRHLLVHVEKESDKLEVLFHMARKLYSFVQGRCVADNADALSSHELLLPGHVITMFVKEKIDEGLQAMKLNMMRDVRVNGVASLLQSIRSKQYMEKCFDRCVGSVGSKVVSLLSTGNIVSSTGLDLMQVSGFTVVAERLNALRYMSHFRAVHRGQFFTTMKTTTVRKLLPESWGFLCPVHTPDGGPCGLLQHLALKCLAVSHPPKELGMGLRRVLTSLGVTPSGVGGGDGQVHLPYHYLPVLIDGVVVGGAPRHVCARVAEDLRLLKAKTMDRLESKEGEEEEELLVEPSTEVAWVPPTDEGTVGAYPGLYVFTRAARMIRPVVNLKNEKIEMIGPLEQVYLEVACTEADIRSQAQDSKHPTTHIEIDATNMLSLIAALTPFSDYNQGPRIMYQCQMGKQTMGTPAHSIDQHPENKAYKIQSPQAPLVQTRRHAEFQMDEYPQGTNAVVAVISYTGYDMEDAMILNKSSYERGFAHASVYKTKVIDLAEERKRSAKPGTSGGQLSFGNFKEGKEGKAFENLDEDGLPQVGDQVHEGDPLVSYVDHLSGKASAVKHKENEPAFVQCIRAMAPPDSTGGGGSSAGSKKGRDPLSRVAVTLRFPRNPIIGDKFSSRHGQKGVMSILWPQQDMPFSESGISPDVIINPHAFPSRMTIGMLLESMAGKAGSMQGSYQDATPFSFNEKHTAVDYFGEQLAKQGYSYYGSEPLYSGLSGEIMHADIYIGVVYYQRLRHMVSDKSQVRAMGPVNSLTRQPIKGRKRHGGIRLGEMERDALLAHGSSFLLLDRLFNCSDKHIAHVCRHEECGSLLGPVTPFKVGSSHSATPNTPRVCRMCNTKCEPVALPYVFRYLTNELAGMNIRISLKMDSWKP